MSTDTWLSGRTGDWSNPSNWSAGVPTSSTDALINSGDSISIAGSANARSLYLAANGATLNLSGSLLVGSSISYGTNANIFINGGSITAGSLGSSGTNIYGYITGYGTVNGLITGNTQINASNGLLKINGDANTNQYLSVINSNSTLEFNGAATTNVLFNGSNATLKLDRPSNYSGQISGVIIGDIIDLVGVSAASATYSGSTLTINQTNGQRLTYNVSGLICPQKVVQLNVSLRHSCLPSRKRPAELVWVAQTGAGNDDFGDCAIGLITTCGLPPEKWSSLKYGY